MPLYSLHTNFYDYDISNRFVSMTCLLKPHFWTIKDSWPNHERWIAYNSLNLPAIMHIHRESWQTWIKQLWDKPSSQPSPGNFGVLHAGEINMSTHAQIEHPSIIGCGVHMMVQRPSGGWGLGAGMSASKWGEGIRKMWVLLYLALNFFWCEAVKKWVNYNLENDGWRCSQGQVQKVYGVQLNTRKTKLNFLHCSCLVVAGANICHWRARFAGRWGGCQDRFHCSSKAKHGQPHWNTQAWTRRLCRSHQPACPAVWVTLLNRPCSGTQSRASKTKQCLIYIDRSKCHVEIIWLQLSHKLQWLVLQ